METVNGVASTSGGNYDGLVTRGEKELRYHAVSYLLQQALRVTLGLGRKPIQKSINITSQRLRYDFAYHQKLTYDEMSKIESFINMAIRKDLPITTKRMFREEALATGAIAPFGPICIDEQTHVVTIGDFVQQIGDPLYVSSIGDLGKFTILKEKSNGRGVRRIYGVLI